METSTLRWILVIAGLVLIAGLFLFGNPNRKPKRRPPRPRRGPNRRRAARRGRKEPVRTRQEPELDTTGASAPDGPEPRQQAPSQPDLGIGEVEPPPEPKPAATPPEKVVVLYLKARDNRRIAGAELLGVTLKSGMTFGDMDIFHRLQKDDPRPVFSLADLTNPGTFDKDAWNTFETHGVTLFMGLPGPMGALDAWDAMLATARRIADVLHLDLLDDRRELFTRQREGEIREELREFVRARQPVQ